MKKLVIQDGKNRENFDHFFLIATRKHASNRWQILTIENTDIPIDLREHMLKSLIRDAAQKLSEIRKPKELL